MATDQSVRTMMSNAGYDNSKIGYDPNSGYVQYNGTNFGKPRMNVNGTTFDSQDAFNGWDNQFKQQNPQSHPSYSQQQANSPYQGGIYTSAEDSIPYAQRLAYYGNNPTATQNEYNRANQALGVYQALASTGDQDAAQKAQDAVGHIQRIQQIMGSQKTAQQAAQPQGPDINGLVNSVYQRVMNPQTYDVYSSPEYAAAQKQADYGTHQNIRAAQEALGTSGIGRSSTLQDEAQRYGTEAQDRLLTQVVPQLIAQHRSQDQQQLGNLTSLLSPLLQQQQMANENSRFDKTYGLQRDQYGLQKQGQEFTQGRTSQQDHIDLANKLSAEYGVHVDPKDDPALAYEQVKGLTPLNAQQIKSQMELQKAQGNYYNDHGAYYDARANAPSGSGSGGITPNQQVNQLMTVWKNTGKAPEGLQQYGVEPGTPYGQAKPPNSSGNFNLNSYKSHIDQNFVKTVPADPANPYGPTTKQFDKDGARKYIIGLNLPDDRTDQLLNMYQLPTN